MASTLNISTDSSDEEEILARVQLFFVNDFLATPALLNACPEILGKEVPGRNENYYEETVPRYTFEEFRSHFRMSRSCFADLMEKVGNKKTVFDLEKKLLFMVWTVSKQESFLSSGDRFNYAKSSAHSAFCEILTVLRSLISFYIKWPTHHNYPIISQAFKEKSGGYIPGVVGAIDGCHIQTKQPLKNAIDYYNRKNTHSVILQAVCDHRCVFTDIYVGAPGRLHDARVFRNSPLFDQINELVPGEYHLLGDSAYPLQNNLVTPFRDNGHLTQRQNHFNTRLSSARVTIERTFGLLKGRFRRLKYLDVAEPKMANHIITGCCILHNHIQTHSPDDFNALELEPDNDIENDHTDDAGPSTSRSNSCPKRTYLLSLF